MDTRLKFIAALIILTLLVFLSVQSAVFAKNPVSTLSKNDRHGFNGLLPIRIRDTKTTSDLRFIELLIDNGFDIENGNLSEGAD